MPLFFGYCPHCDALKAVEGELTTDRQGAGVWEESFTTVSSERIPQDDECGCVLTPAEERAVIASAEDDALNAEPDDPDPEARRGGGWPQHPPLVLPAPPRAPDVVRWSPPHGKLTAARLDAARRCAQNHAMTQQPLIDEAALQAIAQTLGETQREPIRQLRRVITALGRDATYALVAETQQLETQGGMRTTDGQRRRTPGGVFFQLVFQRAPPRARAFIFPRRWTPPRARRSASQIDGAAAPMPAREPFQLDDLPAIIAELASWGAATTVKITVIGRPTQTVERGDVVVVGLVSDTVPSLPKGVPTPATPTNYVVLIARKHWNTVAAALTDAEDRVVIDGYPSYAPQHAGITVYATAVRRQSSRRPNGRRRQSDDDGCCPRARRHRRRQQGGRRAVSTAQQIPLELCRLRRVPAQCTEWTVRRARVRNRADRVVGAPGCGPRGRIEGVR